MQSFLRTFHPVGQGAFYTEQRLDGPEQLTIVYDCGSLTGPLDGFLKKVATALAPGTVIDLLFISHFDEDHVNGLAELQKWHPVRAVVLPKLTEEAHTLVKLRHFLAHGNFTGVGSLLLDNPQAFFGTKTLIILIDPVSEDDSPSPTKGNDNLAITLPTDRAAPPDIPPSLTTHQPEQLTSVPSGTSIRLKSSTSQFWEYVPFNYEYPARKRLLLVQLAALHLAPATLSTLAQVIYHRRALKTAYAKLPGRLNQNSLAVYSGSLDDARQVVHNGQGQAPWWYQRTLAGCLYLGDIELNARNLTRDLQAHLGTRWQHIGTLQVPHHGATKNFNPVIAQAHMQAVISYGTTNSHGHPTPYVIGHLRRLGATAVLVTEALESAFYSHF